MKNLHQEFPSDLFTCLVAVDARIHVGTYRYGFFRNNLRATALILLFNGVLLYIFAGPDNKAFSPEEFLAVDLKGKFVLAMELKAMDGEQFFRTYKVMPRVQVPRYRLDH